MTMAERIKAARIAKSLSVRKLAKAIRVTAGAIYLWEDGTTQKIERANLDALAHALGRSTTWLLTGRDDSAPLPLSPAERQVLEIFSSLDTRDKTLAVALLLVLKDHGDQ